ncbi:MAG: hypothetical protein H6718_04235 [Polyangiaceae bacterium]|nr:hypothetical protein [Polyangiaceae bacterium]
MPYPKPVLHVTPDLHQALRIQAALENRRLSDLVKEILNEGLEKRKEAQR